MGDPITTETARTMRKLWFDYLDTVAPLRPRLHALCVRLAGSIWDGEDLLQDTLLRGFGAIGRGDLHGAQSPFADPAAYLGRTAVNLWIDRIRRRRREAPQADAAVAPRETVVTASAVAALLEHTAPQERAAVVLKDVFDFSLGEIAGLLETTEGAVKAALHRGRGKLAGAVAHRHAPASAELVDRFIAAFDARDIAGVTALLLESVAWEVQGVGGERGYKDAIWLGVPQRANVAGERRVVDGEPVVAFILREGGREVLVGALRLEESGGRIARIVNYFFCPETLALAAAELGMESWCYGYRQDDATLTRMIADTRLPWSA